MKDNLEYFRIEFIISVLERSAHIIKEDHARDYLKFLVAFLQTLSCELNSDKNRVLSPNERNLLCIVASHCYYAVERDVSRKNDPSAHYYLAAMSILKDELEMLARHE